MYSVHTHDLCLLGHCMTSAAWKPALPASTFAPQHLYDGRFRWFHCANPHNHFYPLETANLTVYLYFWPLRLSFVRTSYISYLPTRLDRLCPQWYENSSLSCSTCFLVKPSAGYTKTSITITAFPQRRCECHSALSSTSGKFHHLCIHRSNRWSCWRAFSHTSARYRVGQFKMSGLYC